MMMFGEGGLPNSSVTDVLELIAVDVAASRLLRDLLEESSYTILL